MATITLTYWELGGLLALALLPGADLAKLALALAYRKAGLSPAYADAVQEGEDVDPEEADGSDDAP